MFICFSFFFIATATTEIYTILFVGSVRCVQETDLILLMYFLFQVTGNSCFCTYSGIEKQASIYYNTDEGNILWFANGFLMVYVFISFPSAWWISYNFKYAYYFATFFNAFGGWVRYFAFKNMPLAIFGEALIGVGQNFGFPALLYIPNRWFSKKEKFAALCISSQSIFLGMGLGYLFSPLYIGNDYTCLLYTSPSPRDRQKSRMPSSA
eukprot:TRINITY_DN2232_c0_g3_i1.p1 TRINITY_DN2232_c0_g3~~TRINITY_DN2232_c0_g3_i1.p1  ORF type:complete len:209 (-),score=38.13 TRINITY_DN2232_c0_g3_i1:38-664(-)